VLHIAGTPCMNDSRQFFASQALASCGSSLSDTAEAFILTPAKSRCKHLYSDAKVAFSHLAQNCFKAVRAKPNKAELAAKQSYSKMNCKGLYSHFVVCHALTSPASTVLSLCGTGCPQATPSSSSFFFPHRFLSLFFLSSLHIYFSELREASLLAAALHNPTFPSSP